MSDFKKVLAEIKNINTRLADIESSINSTGLTEGRIPQLTGQELNSLDSFSGFRYLADCTLNGELLPNGYLLQLIYAPTYKIQFFIDATIGVLQYRKMINGTWNDFTNV